MLHPTLPGKPGRTPRAARLILAGVLAAGLCTTVVLWLWVGRIVRQSEERDLTVKAEQYAGMVQRRFGDLLLPVSSLAVFLASHGEPAPHPFRLVAEAANRLGVPAGRLGWAPRITHAERLAHEATARREGLEGYRIVTFGPDGVFLPAPDRAEYFPIRFEMTAPGFPSALGFDVASTPDRRPYVERARALRTPMGLIPGLRQLRLRETGFLIVYWPVYADGASAQMDPPDGLRGFVTSVVTLADLFRGLMRGVAPMEGRLVVHAAPWDGSPAQPVAHFTEATGLVMGAPADPQASFLRRSFTLLGVTWHVDYEPGPEERDGWRVWVAATVLPAGLAMTLAVTAALFFLMRQLCLERDLRDMSVRVLEQQSARAREVEALNAQLQVQEQLARKAALVRSRLLASASHDVRQPLQAMLVHAAILELGARDAPTKRAVAGLKNAVLSLRGMFGVFLDLHRLDEDKVRVARGYLELEGLLRALCDEFELAADRKGIRLRLRAPACALWTDPAILEVVLRNLIGNAVKFTRRGGVLVAVRVRREVEIQVWDTGPGIAAPALEQLFEEFTQVSDDRSGAGLGLSIARRMAALIGGRIQVRSIVGRGSCFTLSLPRHDGAARIT